MIRQSLQDQIVKNAGYLASLVIIGREAQIKLALSNMLNTAKKTPNDGAFKRINKQISETELGSQYELELEINVCRITVGKTTYDVYSAQDIHSAVLRWWAVRETGKDSEDFGIYDMSEAESQHEHAIAEHHHEIMIGKSALGLAAVGQLDEADLTWRQQLRENDEKDERRKS
jgi:hypothetical protein